MSRSKIRLLVLLALLAALLMLQAQLWFGNGSLRNSMLLAQQVTQLTTENAQLEERNRLKAADVHELKNGYKEVQEIARKDLGMIKPDELFYQIIDGKLPERHDQIKLGPQQPTAKH